MSELLYWSDGMERVFRDQVIAPVRDHPDTDFTENVLLGYPFLLVREEVIAKGLADFSTGYDHLSADDKVLLYCFINFKKHFYACRTTYNLHRAELDHWLGGESPVVCDLGCGPGTAGLALCDTLPGVNWDYVGIDSSSAMRRMTERLFDAARSAQLFGSKGTVRLCESWTQCGPELVRPAAPLLVICSYLFASLSLNTAILRGLADWLRSVCQVADRPIALLVYLNSTNPHANTNYEYFKTLFGLDPLAHQPTKSEVQFRKNRNSTAVGTDEFLHELLILKGG